MVGDSPARTKGVSGGASMIKRSVDFASSANGCQPICSRIAGRFCAVMRKIDNYALRVRRMCGLPNVFHVTGDSVIDGVAFDAKLAVIMPGRITVAVKCFADNRAGEIRIPIYREVRAWSVKHGSEVARRIDIDVLRGSRIWRTNRIILHIGGDAALVDDVTSFYIHI